MFTSTITSIIVFATFATFPPIIFAGSTPTSSGEFKCTPQRSHTTYPNQCRILEIFNYLATGSDEAFFAQVAPDVDWTVMGTHPLAGEYHNRTIFIADTLERLANTEDPSNPLTLSVTNIIGGGNDEWSVQELHVLGSCKNGKFTYLLVDAIDKDQRIDQKLI